jgi:hypothetical protein
MQGFFQRILHRVRDAAIDQLKQDGAQMSVFNIYLIITHKLTQLLPVILRRPMPFAVGWLQPTS